MNEVTRHYDILDEADLIVPDWHIFWKRDFSPMNGTTKQRRLCVPKGRQMNEILGVLRNRVRGLSGKMPSATGFRKGMSVIDSVRRHQVQIHRGVVFNRFICVFDLKKAYRSVDSGRLALVLAQINPHQFSGYRRTVDFLNKFCFDPQYGGLAMGSTASNDLFNVYCEFLVDRDLRRICESHGLTYTRYADDLTFSSQNIISKEIRRNIRMVLESAGFVVNDKKARVYDLRRGPVEINGIGITYEGKTFLPRRVLVPMRGMIHCAISDSSARRELLPRIRGFMGLFRQVTDLSRLNQTESYLLDQYEKLLNLCR